MKKFMKFLIFIFCNFYIFLGVLSAETKEYKIILKDGEIIPLTIEVKAKTRFRLIIENMGTTPSEFEMNNPIKELVLAPGSTGSVGMRPLDAGEYIYFDDFHPNSPRGKIVVKE